MRHFDRHQLKLGLFGLNCSGGLSATLAPERWEGTWEENLAAAKMADAGGSISCCRWGAGKAMAV